ncbi:MAG: hypothetical protein KBT39_05385, partial [Bacteroidales bacterium]|nr:hypothetical protein [Bacteroidales bacterium]
NLGFPLNFHAEFALFPFYFHKHLSGIIFFCTNSWVVQAQDNNKKPAFSEIILHMGKLADMGGQPTADDWEKLHQHILTLHPNWQHSHNLEASHITPQELQLCLLSTTPLRPKQISTLLGVSQQNLRNMRVRLYTRITGQPCTGVEQFTR